MIIEKLPFFMDDKKTAMIFLNYDKPAIASSVAGFVQDLCITSVFTSLDRVFRPELEVDLFPEDTAVGSAKIILFLLLFLFLDNIFELFIGQGSF